ncbi:MAG: HAD-IA family hydrolase [Pleurocapsa minor HA4230-MV1]|jgi:pseudouridine-5'-monophosphatase|nr:HAD-IA family hydrolase [Pleurocapsa minor HA4230-MV1]
MFKSITHVIYDLDGLLLNTESLYEQVNREVAKRYGKTFNQQAKMAIAGRPTLDSARILVELLELPLTAGEYLIERNQLLYPLYGTAQVLPGTVELIQHLAAHRIPQAIASSSSRHHFEMKTINHHHWLKLLTIKTLGDDPQIKQGKPAPDIFLLAAKRLKANPEQCLVFEDSVAGMQSAIAAGMSVVVIPDVVFDPQLFKAADQILGSMLEFNPQDWDLPGY